MTSDSRTTDYETLLAHFRIGGYESNGPASVIPNHDGNCSRCQSLQRENASLRERLEGTSILVTSRDNEISRLRRQLECLEERFQKLQASQRQQQQQQQPYNGGEPRGRICGGIDDHDLSPFPEHADWPPMGDEAGEPRISKPSRKISVSSVLSSDDDAFHQPHQDIISRRSTQVVSNTAGRGGTETATSKTTTTSTTTTTTTTTATTGPTSKTVLLDPLVTHDPMLPATAAAGAPMGDDSSSVAGSSVSSARKRQGLLRASAKERALPREMMFVDDHHHHHDHHNHDEESTARDETTGNIMVGMDRSFYFRFADDDDNDNDMRHPHHHHHQDDESFASSTRSARGLLMSSNKELALPRELSLMKDDE